MHDDGSEIEVSAGDAYYFAPGHDGWVVGDETVIAYEAQFFTLPTVSYDFLTNAFNPEKFTKPVFTRNLSVRR